jgi:hypothetical protein
MKNIPKYSQGYLIPHHQLNIPITKGQESPRVLKYYYDGKG